MRKQNRQSGIENFSFVAIVLFCLRANLDQNFLETTNNLLTFIVSDFFEIRFVLQKQSLKHRKQLKESSIMNSQLTLHKLETTKEKNFQKF